MSVMIFFYEKTDLGIRYAICIAAFIPCYSGRLSDLYRDVILKDIGSQNILPWER